jgi:hypothetical protein
MEREKPFIAHCPDIDLLKEVSLNYEQSQTGREQIVSK